MAMGFGMVWYMWWLAALGFVGMIVAAVAHTFNYKRDYYVPADEVARLENERTRLLAPGVPA
jgi:cytochrome o ubiquinol oxidase subunit 1